MKWFKKRRQALIRDIAKEVIDQLGNSRGWRKFLPPVALRDCVYFVTEDGMIYKMKYDGATEMEVFMKVMDRL
jgi:hypothetical protein